MSTRPKAHAGPAVLRARAAKELAERAALDASLRAETESTRLLHELKVHQIELEIQNEELVEARDELESGLNRYTELFDFAPLGYALIDAEFEIRELNLAGAELLGSERARLVGQSFNRFVSAHDRNNFANLIARVVTRGARESAELDSRVTSRPERCGFTQTPRASLKS